MRVLQINSVCGIGSTGRIATDIHNILIEQGHESYIAYGRDLPKNCDNAIRIGTRIDNYTHVAKTRVLDRHGFGSKKATIEFIDEVKELDPDIIHLHNIHGYYINIEILFNYLKEANKPVVWTLHDCWSFTGHCTYFDYAGCNKWMTGCYDCIQKGEYPKSIFADFSKQNYENKKRLFNSVNNMIFVTPSKWLADLVKKSYLSDYPVKVINNGIDVDLFKPIKSDFREKYNIKGKEIVLGIASVWEKRKGLETFIELSRRLSEDYRIILVGLSDKQLRDIPKSIIGIKRTNNVKELAEIYTAADFFVNPTLEDNYPTTNLEAIACGTPVITYDTGGSPESIDKETGIVVKQGDIEELVKVITDNKFSPLKIESVNFINKVKKNYSKREKFLEYIKIYEEIYL